MTAKAIRGIVIGVAVLGITAYGVTRLRAGAKPKVTAGRTVLARTGDLTVKVSETGTLEPVVKVDVKSRVAGRLQRIYVKAGDRITAGAPIASVDPTEVAREVAGIEAQLAASRAGMAQSEENYRLTQAQNALAIRRAEVNLENAKVGLKDALVGLRDAEVGVTQAEKRLVQTAAPTRSQEIEQAQTSLSRIEAQIVDARRTYERRKRLVEKGFISEQEADLAQTQVQLAEADRDSAKQRLALLREGPRREDIDATKIGVDTAKVRVQQARVRVEQAQIAIQNAQVQLATEKANAAQAQLRRREVERARADVRQVENRLAQQSVQLRETNIVAPISGEVTGKYLEEGELVASATAGFAQGAALVTIADLSRMQVKVNVNEVDVSRLRLGLPVEIRIDGVANQVFKGKVTAIAPASLGSTQTQQSNASGQGGVVRFEVKITVTDRDPRLRPGMTAAVDIILDRHSGVVLLPTEAIRDKTRVLVVTGAAPKTTKTERTVKLGLRDEAMVEILDGVRTGEQVEVPKVEAKDRRKINIDGPNQE